MNFLSGSFPSSLASEEIMIGDERYYCSFLLELADERRTGQMNRAWAPPQKLQMWRKRQRCLKSFSSLRLLGNEVQITSVYLLKAMQNSASVRTRLV